MWQAGNSCGADSLTMSTKSINCPQKLLIILHYSQSKYLNLHADIVSAKDLYCDAKQCLRGNC